MSREKMVLAMTSSEGRTWCDSLQWLRNEVCVYMLLVAKDLTHSIWHESAEVVPRG